MPGQERQYDNFTSLGAHTLLLLLDGIPKENKGSSTLKAHEKMFSLNEKCKITWVIFSWIRFPLKTNNLKITTKQNKYLLSPLVLWGTFFKLLLKETNQEQPNISIPCPILISIPYTGNSTPEIFSKESQPRIPLPALPSHGRCRDFSTLSISDFSLDLPNFLAKLHHCPALLI